MVTWRINNAKVSNKQKLNKMEKTKNENQCAMLCTFCEKEIYELAELLMQSANLEATATILRDFAEKCYQEGAIDAQNDAAEEIREHYVEGGI